MSSAATIATSRRSRWLQLALIPPLLAAILFIDSRAVAEQLPYNQWLANLFTLAYFVWMLRDAGRRLRRLMLIGVLVACVGEVLFSLLLGMYEYRLHNVPLYVPPGHAILYASVFLLLRETWLRRHIQWVVRLCYAGAVTFSVAWLLLYNDIYGFICFVLFTLLIQRRRESRPFFVVMFLLVVYLELLGTYFQCWSWPPYLLQQWPAIPSANPPSGIAVFYIGFDIACLGLYRLSRAGLRARYQRRRNLRSVQPVPTTSELATDAARGSD